MKTLQVVVVSGVGSDPSELEQLAVEAMRREPAVVANGWPVEGVRWVESDVVPLTYAAHRFEADFPNA